MGCSSSQLAQRPEVDVTKRGVSLAYLQQFTSEAIVLHGEALRVSDLVSLVVRPRCDARHCCLHELIPPEFKGQPKFFISHTWSRRVAALVAALTSFFSTDDPCTIHIWLDVIAINQVPYATNKGLLQDDVSSLSKVWQTLVRKSVSGLIILDFELDLTQLREVYNNMSVSRAQATLEEDRERILAEIDESIGHSHLDLAIREALVEGTRLGLMRVQHQEQEQDGLRNGDQSQENEDGLPKGQTAHTRLRVANALHKYGGMLIASGQPRSAECLLRSCWEIRKEFLREDDLLTMTAEHTLAQCLHELGDHEGGLAHAERVFQSRRQTLGEQHTSTCDAATTQAVCYRSLGKFEEAEEIFRSVLARKEGDPTPDSSGLVAAISDLAGCLMLRGKYADARQLLVHGHSLSLDSFGKHGHTTLNIASNLAGCYVLEGEYGEGQELHKEILDVRIQKFGPHHPASAASMVSLGGCMRAQGNPEGAYQLYSEAAHIRTNMLGAAHPLTLTVRNSLAICLEALGRSSEAEPIYLEVLKGREDALGPEHPDTLQTVNDLGCCYAFNLDVPEKAELLFRRSVSGRKLSLGPDHPDTLVSLNNLAVSMRMQNKNYDAVPLLQEAFTAYQQQLPSPPAVANPDSVNPAALNCMRTLKLLASTQQLLGQLDDAIALFQVLADLRGSWYGLGHVLALEARHMLGEALQEASRNEEAEKVLTPVLQERLQVLGEEHEDTQDTIAVLAAAFEALGLPVTRSQLGLPQKKRQG
ncbi:hypothetical protein DUNSADRAFT_15666 [Dunaliella salina]|uniref:Kinesin light chain n=1 Tax=Dunaliella salina TaxID=3046 RepID=A0ABQ7G4Y3_DUNSA|nr:hypothetical protein DUNSADRAFT_15666 [Dunaliella salina]|eukprot:KAF5829666.1 hypothetical protein DUNSADRAFT_15666 [Dunaliella salina]